MSSKYVAMLELGMNLLFEPLSTLSALLDIHAGCPDFTLKQNLFFLTKFLKKNSAEVSLSGKLRNFNHVNLKILF